MDFIQIYVNCFPKNSIHAHIINGETGRVFINFRENNMFYGQICGQKSVEKRRVNRMGRHGENIRKRSDGRWEARYMAYDEEKGVKVCRSVYGHTYEEAKEKRAAASMLPAVLAQMGNALEQGIDALKDIDFETAAREWMATVKAAHKLSTFEKYRFIYHSYLEKAFGGMMIRQVTEKTVRDSLASCGAASESLQKSIYGVLNGILRYTAGQYHMMLPEIKRPPVEAHRKEAGTFTKSEQTKLLSVLCANMDRFRLAVLMCLFTGLRLGELCALKWSDIDFKNKTLNVRRTVQRLYVENAATKTALVETAPKSGNSKREIPLQDTIAGLLTDYQNGKEYVFGGDKPLDPRTMQNQYKKILKEACVSYKNFHTLRHTYATNCIEGGTDIKSLSEMLGHSSVKITLNYYVHPSMDTKRRYADSLCEFYIRLHGQVLGRAG